MIVFDQNYATDNSCGEMKKRFCKYEGARPWRDIRTALSFLRLSQRDSKCNLFLSLLEMVS